MDSLDERLFLACSRGEIENVKFLLEKGANMNVICTTGKTSFGVAAELGNTALIKILINYHNKLPSSQMKNKNEDKSKPKDDEKSNLGYFVYVHNENKIKGMNSGCENDDEFEVLQTPEGMDNLEWDVEIDKDVEAQTEDQWGALYRWYADVLSETSCLLEDKPNPYDINKEDQYGKRAVHYAAAGGHVEILDVLIEAGCKLNIGDSDNFTPLHLAAAKDVPEIMNKLIKAGADVNQRTSDKTAPLHISSSRGLLDNVKLLVSSGAHIDCLDSSDRTPLFLAVSRIHTNVISYLITLGAKVNIEEIHGYTPLCEAVWQKEVSVVENLLAAGAKITQSHYLLHYAVLHHHYQMVALLITAGSIINLRDVNGDTPLILAIKTGQPNTVRLLLENGACVNYTNHVTGETPLHVAVDHARTNQQFDEIFAVLEEYNVNLDAESEAGYTPLYLAIIHEQYYPAEILIKHGADVNHPNKPYLFNVFFYLIHKKNLKIPKMLVYSGYQLNSNIKLSVNSSPVDLWVHNVKTNPMKLADLCRIRIRSHWKSKIYNNMSNTVLPMAIKKYLTLEDVCNNY